MTIALNILRTEEKVLCPAYISKIYSNCEIQIALLMILNEEKGWHYLAIKKNYLHDYMEWLQNKGAFYCSNCRLSFRTENKFKSHEKVCKSKDFCGIVRDHP